MLAQIEKGEVNPTISILWKIANGYKVSFTSLVKYDASPLLIKSEDVIPLIENDEKYINYPAFPFQEDKQFETYRIEIKEGGYLQDNLIWAELKNISLFLTEKLKLQLIRKYFS